MVLNALPGANCGACGYPGCNGYATRIVTDGIEITLCPVGGESSVNRIAEIMGIDSSSAAGPVIARVHCQGGISETVRRFNYVGPSSCAAAQDVMGGFKVCEFGCLGYGDCRAACPFDAIQMSGNDLPVINWDKCTGCGKCVTACPRNIISLVPEKLDMHVICRNTQKAPQMLKGCSVGCIACQLCVKACKEVFKDNPEIETAIQVIDFLAVIDYDLCINCGKCAEACKKQKVISFGRLGSKI
jgi:Na+-translocating ferredoxin:NAD+ oxidoreductase RNF subunit RnfB